MRNDNERLDERPYRENDTDNVTRGVACLGSVTWEGVCDRQSTVYSSIKRHTNENTHKLFLLMQALLRQYVCVAA